MFKVTGTAEVVKRREKKKKKDHLTRLLNGKIDISLLNIVIDFVHLHFDDVVSGFLI